MKKLYLVVDMQNDFLTGILGCKECEKTIDVVNDILANKITKDDTIILTKDTHDETYPTTLEGKSIPPHCIKGTQGHNYPSSLEKIVEDLKKKNEVIEIEKPTFGSSTLLSYLMEEDNSFDEIYIMGVCTSICVHANAVICRTALPNSKITLIKNACGDFSKEASDATYISLKALQIDSIESL